MRYTHHLHTTLDDVRIGEKVLIAHRPNPAVTIRVSSGVVDAVNAAFVRIAWEGTSRPARDTFTEDELCYLAFAEPEPTIDLDNP
jgi:hypothetical protein